MNFNHKATTIAPEGRNKYGNYFSAANTYKRVSQVTYGGDTSTGGNEGNISDDKIEDKNFLLFLSKTSGTLNGMEIAIAPVTDTTEVIGYHGTERNATYVGNIQGDTPEGEEPPLDYSITGLTSGMTVLVSNNATTATTISITFDSGLTQNEGSLQIPCNVHLDNDPVLDDDIQDWESFRDECMTLVLEYTWSVNKSSSNVYTLELSNDSAGINCDSGGTILPGAIRPTCTATLSYGTDPVSGAVYGISYSAGQSVQGVSINSSTGVLTFGSNFQFEGTGLEITVSASVSGSVVAYKIMTITKSFPGADGVAAITKWLVLNADSVHYNPNTSAVMPSAITAYVMAQKGEEAAYVDTGETIYYGWETDTPGLVYDGPIEIDTTKKYLALCLKKDNIQYETETITILSDGENGTPGIDGQSVYRLDLSNQNAGINADSGGTILAGAVRPTCTAKLYYGENPASGVSYSLSYPSTVQGVSINSSTGVLTFNSGTAATPFNFNGTTVELTVSARIGGVLKGTAIMVVSKNYAGGDGQDATNYWLVMSSDAVKVSSGGTVSPSTITASAYKQIGEQTPVTATDCTIKYGYNTTSPSTTYTSAITVDGTKDYITFKLLKNNIQMDLETVPILKDGKDGSGEQGRQGAAIRGPVDWWKQTTVRRFCNGQFTSSSYPEDALWIDVMLKDNYFYYCNTSYNGSCNDSWSTVSSKWTRADQQFNFIATNLLLANNAAIDFLTGNEIYLRDSNSNITAGAAGGNGISFWAGSDTPSEAPFQVNADGSIKATSGTFSGFIQMPYAELETVYTPYSGDTYYRLDKSYSYLYTTVHPTASYQQTIYFPNPTDDYNGFVYNIIAYPVVGRIPPSGSTLMVAHMRVNATGNTAIFYNFSRLPVEGYINEEGINRIDIGPGFYQFVCIKNHWVLVQATGYAQGFTSNTAVSSYQNVVSRSVTEIVRISGSDTRNKDTALYVQG